MSAGEAGRGHWGKGPRGQPALFSCWLAPPEGACHEIRLLRPFESEVYEWAKGAIYFAQPPAISCGVTPSDAARLRAGVDFPRDRTDFERFFPGDQACSRYLEELRLPEGFICRRCHAVQEPWRMKRRLLLCPTCRTQTSVTVGTIFEGTRKPLKLWFLAAWEITGHKCGANALTLQRMPGPSPCAHARGTPGRLLGEALASRNLPGCSEQEATRLLPRRIHLPVQPPLLSVPWAPVPQTPGTRGSDRLMYRLSWARGRG